VIEMGMYALFIRGLTIKQWAYKNASKTAGKFMFNQKYGDKDAILSST